MRVTVLEFDRGLQNELAEFLKSKIKFGYVGEGAEWHLVWESFYFRTASVQMAVVTIGGAEARTLVRVVVGGGKAGLFEQDWGTEDSMTKTILHHVVEFSAKYQAPHRIIEARMIDND